MALEPMTPRQVGQLRYPLLCLLWIWLIVGYRLELWRLSLPIFITAYAIPALVAFATPDFILAPVLMAVFFAGKFRELASRASRGEGPRLHK